MSFELPKLNYDYNALEPSIDAQTMEIHHTKHHAGYVNKLNVALQDYPEFANMPIEDLLLHIDDVPEVIRQKVINNGGGHANHTLFWEILSPDGGGSPTGEFAEELINQFGDFEGFKDEFSEKATSVFGSGWAFLILDNQGKLKIKRHSFQNSPLMHGNTPILGLDVWEHAYYLKYQNKRAAYVEAFWDIVDWKKVGELYEAASEK